MIERGLLYFYFGHLWIYKVLLVRKVWEIVKSKRCDLKLAIKVTRREAGDKRVMLRTGIELWSQKEVIPCEKAKGN